MPSPVDRHRKMTYLSSIPPPPFPHSVRAGEAARPSPKVYKAAEHWPWQLLHVLKDGR